MSDERGLSRAELVDRAEYCHEHDELTWVAAGSCTLLIESRRWQIGMDTALVVPAGVPHTVLPRPDSLVFPLIFPEGLTSAASPAVIDRTAVLDANVRVLLQPGLATEESIAAARRAVRDVVTHGLGRPESGLVLPLDSRARQVATTLLAHPASPLRLEDWARTVHTSGKTLQRCFRRDTGMTFPEWRTSARLASALPRLERGDSVTAVAQSVGFASPSAFISAFRRRHGVTPGDYRDRVAVGR